MRIRGDIISGSIYLDVTQDMAMNWLSCRVGDPKDD